MDRGSLYKLALSYLGIADYVPGSAEEHALRDVEQHTLALASAYTPWRWAQRVATLSLTNGKADLPDDYLELRSCSLSQWELIGRSIVTSTSATSADIVYSSTAWADSLTIPDHQPLFAEGLALLLAAKAAVRISNSHQLAAALEQQANHAFYRAKLAEVRSVRSNDQQPANWKDSLPWVTP